MRIHARSLRTREGDAPATSILSRDTEEALRTMDRRPSAIIRAPTALEAVSLARGRVDIPT